MTMKHTTQNCSLCGKEYEKLTPLVNGIRKVGEIYISLSGNGWKYIITSNDNGIPSFGRVRYRVDCFFTDASDGKYSCNSGLVFFEENFKQLKLTGTI